MKFPFGKILIKAFLQLCEPDTVKSSHLSDQIHAVTSPNLICLITVPWKKRLSSYQMAPTSLSPNGYRAVEYSPQNPSTPCPADAAAVARMRRMHVTCRNTGRTPVVPSGLHNSVAQPNDWSPVSVQKQDTLRFQYTHLRYNFLSRLIFPFWKLVNCFKYSFSLFKSGACCSVISCIWICVTQWLYPVWHSWYLFLHSPTRQMILVCH